MKLFIYIVSLGLFILSALMCFQMGRRAGYTLGETKCKIIKEALSD